MEFEKRMVNGWRMVWCKGDLKFFFGFARDQKWGKANMKKNIESGNKVTLGSKNRGNKAGGINEKEKLIIS